MERDDPNREPRIVLPAGMQLVVPPPAHEEVDDEEATATLRLSAPVRPRGEPEARDGTAGARP